MDGDLLRELFASLGPIQIRRLFGGQGIYADGLILALVVRGTLMLKADAQSAPAFEAAGSIPWSYERPKSPPVRMPYFSAPDEIFDDPDRATHWVGLALEAARRSAVVKKPSSKAKRPR